MFFANYNFFLVLLKMIIIFYLYYFVFHTDKKIISSYMSEEQSKYIEENIDSDDYQDTQGNGRLWIVKKKY